MITGMAFMNDMRASYKIAEDHDNVYRMASVYAGENGAIYIVPMNATVSFPRGFYHVGYTMCDIPLAQHKAPAR